MENRESKIEKPKINETNLMEQRWSELDTDLLELVLKKLDFLDIISFKAVCSSWKKTAQSYISCPSSSLPQAPWLIPHAHHKYGSFPRTFFRFTQKKADDLNKSGSPHGWMMVSRGETIPSNPTSPIVVNPFSLQRLELPSVETLNFGDVDIEKAILLSDPFGTKNYDLSVVVVLYDHWRTLAFCNVAGAGAEWTVFYTACDTDKKIYDILSHNGELYVLLRDFSVRVWDFSRVNFPMKTQKIIPPSPSRPNMIIQNYPDEYFCMLYLVESMEEILVVLRMTSFNLEPSTMDFFVFNLSGDKVENLQGRALLVGCPSLSISTKDFPEFEDNCIYFLGDYLYWSYSKLSIGGMGVYNLGNKSFKRFHELG